METTEPQSPHEEFTQKHAAWRASTQRVQPLTREQAEARIRAAQRYADTQGKADKVAKAKATKASAERLHANRTAK